MRRSEICFGMRSPKSEQDPDRFWSHHMSTVTHGLPPMDPASDEQRTQNLAPETISYAFFHITRLWNAMWLYLSCQTFCHLSSKASRRWFSLRTLLLQHSIQNSCHMHPIYERAKQSVQVCVQTGTDVKSALPVSQVSHISSCRSGCDCANFSVVPRLLWTNLAIVQCFTYPYPTLECYLRGAACEWQVRWPDLGYNSRSAIFPRITSRVLHFWLIPFTARDRHGTEGDSMSDFRE